MFPPISASAPHTNTVALLPINFQFKGGTKSRKWRRSHIFQRELGNGEGRTSSNESIAHLCALSTPPPKYPLPVFCNILESLFNPTKRYNQPTHKHPRQVQRHAGQQPAGPGPKEKSRWHNSIGSFVSINPCHFFHELVNRTPLRSNGNQQALRVLNY